MKIVLPRSDTSSPFTPTFPRQNLTGIEMMEAGLSPANQDAALRRAIRRELPATTFQRSPRRILFVLPLVGGIVLLSITIILFPLPWILKMAVALGLGNTYAALMFFAHEVAHGAVVKSRRVQDAVLFLGCGIFCFSPQLWRVWHNTVHHSHTNDPLNDPDHFGTLDGFLVQPPVRRALIKLTPGMSAVSALVFLASFSAQAQNVLWARSQEIPGFQELRRTGAKLHSVGLFSFWLALGIALGPSLAFYVILVPFFVANSVVMSYVVTNHLLMPLTEGNDTLMTTMSVTTLPLLDRLHFHFSHHAEHHLFPTVPSSRYALIRSFLRTNEPTKYIAPAHWRALRAAFTSPRIYEQRDILCDPYSDRRIKLNSLHAHLSSTVYRSP